MKTTTRFGLVAATALAISGSAFTLGAAPDTPTYFKPLEPRLTANLANEENKPGELSNDQLFQQLQEVRGRLDRMLQDGFRAVGVDAGWFDDTRFRATVRLTEVDGNYVIRVSMPDGDLSKVDAIVEEGNTLRITAKGPIKIEEKSDLGKTKALASQGIDRYEQLLKLPGAVDASKLNIERAGSTLTITLPKMEQTETAPSKQ